MFHGVILAGGRGERLWPVNRWNHPKHLLISKDGESMLEKSIRRIEALISPKHVMVVTHRNYIDSIRDHLQGRIKVGDFIVEPEGKNTAVAIGLAALKLLKQDPKAIMFVLPADHYIGEEDRLLQVLRAAARITLETDSLVTVGVNPARPEDRYGYIEVGQPMDGEYDVPVFKVTAFKEKPDAKEAEAFLSSGNYLWNSGMYVWRAKVLVDALERFMPELYGGLQAISDDLGTDNEQTALEGLYERIGNISIDYGIMEKAEDVVVIRGSFRWEDFADWEIVTRVHSSGRKHNVISGTVVPIDSNDNLIWCEDGITATLGVSDLIIVKKDDAVLVCSRERAEEVKKIVAALRKKKLDKFT